MDTIDLGPALAAAAAEPAERRGLSQMARSLRTSEILTIAYDVKDRIAAGADILNLTVGDFSSAEYPLLAELKNGIAEALEAGHSNYPPAPGVPELRRAVRDLYERRLGLSYPLDSVLVASGARPLIAGSYLALVDAGDLVVFGTPSWNNDHYAGLVNARTVELETSAVTHFFPEVGRVEPHLHEARLIVMNTPQNPTGTVMPTADLERLARMVVSENERRRALGQRALYLLFDQIYWMLTFDGAKHVSPVQVVPESAPYVIHVDGISKGFAATGLRVGYGVGPVDVVKRMVSILTHLGCWAPRPEQIATARVLDDDALLDRHIATMQREAGDRLRILAEAITAVKSAGHPVTAIAPEGAIYLSIHFDLVGRRRPDGVILDGDEAVRRYLLDAAGLALVPFRAFGAADGTGWFRASVGTVSREQCASVEGRLLSALGALI